MWRSSPGPDALNSCSCQVQPLPSLSHVRNAAGRLTFVTCSFSVTFGCFCGGAELSARLWVMLQNADRLTAEETKCIQSGCKRLHLSAADAFQARRQAEGMWSS